MIGAIIQLRAEPDIIWDSAVSLSTMGVNSSYPSVVMDANANATAIWIENGVVKASFLPAGMGWGTAVPLSGSGASSPKIKVDSSGNVTAIWLESTGVVMSSRLPFGGSWTAAVPISAAGASQPRLGVTPSGDAVVTWVRGGFIESATKQISLGVWSLVSMLSGANSNNPDLAVSANGTAIAVWHTVVAGQDQILSSTTVIGGTWTPVPKTIIAGTFLNNYPRVAMDASGNAGVLWFRYVPISGFTTQFQNIFVAVSILSSGGATWTTAQLISDVGAGNPATFSAIPVIDAQGNILALWAMSFDGSSYTIQAAVRQAGQTFSSANTIATSLYSYNVDGAINAVHDAVIAYMTFDGTNTAIQATETLVSGVINNFTSAITLSTSAANISPRVATVLNGSTINAVAVWSSFDGSNTIVTAATGSRSTIAPPTNLMVVQNSNNFGAFTEYFNTFTWTASTDPEISGYAIFRDGLFQRVLSATDTSFVDNNQVQNGSIQYGIATLRNDGSQSAVVTVNFP